MKRIRVFTVIWWALLAFPLIASSGAGANDGYEVIGQFTFTSFGPRENPIYKNVMLFDVKMFGETWSIRTEPAVEGGGIAYYEVSFAGSNSVSMLTAFESSHQKVESPFEKLRDELRKANGDDSLSADLFPRGNGDTSNSFLIAKGYLSPRSERSPTNSTALKNAATAIILEQKYPPVNPSGAALLWLALTPPDIRTSNDDKMLLQVWDDGQPIQTRFRRVHLSQYDQPPHLISNVTYFWDGQKLLSGGKVEILNGTTSSATTLAAAKYEVVATTNIGGKLFPKAFSLTRFQSKTLSGVEPRKLSTVVASIVSIRKLESIEPATLTVAGKTYVNDYRFIGEGMQGPLSYTVSSNWMPSVAQIKESGFYRRGMAATTSEPHLAGKRFSVMVAMLLCTFLTIVYLIWSTIARKMR